MKTLKDFLNENVIQESFESMDYFTSTIIPQIEKALGFKWKERPNVERFEALGKKVEAKAYQLEKGENYVYLYTDRMADTLLGFGANFSDADGYEKEVAATFKKLSDVLKKIGVNVKDYKTETVDGYVDNKNGCVRAFAFGKGFTIPEDEE